MSPDNGQELSEPISGSYADYLESEQVDSRIDQPRIRAAVREILLAIGEDPDRSGLKDTPARVARAYAEIFTGLHQDPRT